MACFSVWPRAVSEYVTTDGTVSCTWRETTPLFSSWRNCSISTFRPAELCVNVLENEIIVQIYRTPMLDM